MQTTWHDVKYTLRIFRRRPFLSTTAILSLAIAIAGNAAIFSVADALLLRPLSGIRDGDRLVEIGRTQDGTGFDNMSYPNFVDYRDRTTVFEALAGIRVTSDALGFGSDGGAQSVQGTSVSANYFAVLGVPMAIGREFRPDEDRPEAASPVTVISNDLWRNRFASDPNIVGRAIRLNGRTVTIVGVAAPEFRGHNISPADLWIPLTLRPELVSQNPRMLTMREGVWVMALGRLRSGVTLEQAREQMERVAKDLEREHPVANRGKGVALSPWGPLPHALRGSATTFIGLLFALVALVLVIACTNVGGMLLAHGVTRTRELAVRLALGAGRGRVIRMLITESVLLATAGAAVGVAGAFALIRLMERVVPVLPVSVAADFQVDWRVIVFSALLSIVAGLFAGLLPALEGARTDLATFMKLEAAARGPRRMRLRQSFVVGQVAIALMLLVTALLFARSLTNANRIDPGFSVKNVEVAEFDLRLAGYDARRGSIFATELLSRVEQLPEVVSAAWSDVIPLTMSGVRLGLLRLPGQPVDGPGIQADWNAISPRYFETLRMSLVRGRSFADTDLAGFADVAIVNETFARRIWPQQDPLGQVLLSTDAGRERTLRVVGVARDAKYRTLGEAARNFIYVPHTQHYRPDLSLIVQTTGASAIPAIRILLSELDSDVPLVRAEPLSVVTAFSLVPHRVAGAIAGSVGVIGLLLAAIGIYGLTAYTVSQRTREIGIRVAVGAQRGRVLRMILRHTAMQVAVGALFGLALAALGSRFLRGFLYGIQPIDPTAFLGGALVLFTVALLASLSPAIGATRVDPMATLRAE